MPIRCGTVLSSRNPHPLCTPCRPNPPTAKRLLGALCTCAALAVQAQPLAPQPPEPQPPALHQPVPPPQCALPPTGTPAAEALATLRGLHAHCHKQAPYLYALGQLLNQAGHYDEAIDPLEGALLYQPDHWPSQLEYAIALEGVGDHPSALGLLQLLQNNPAVDAITRQHVAALTRQADMAPSLHHRGHYVLAAGHDNNLLGSTYHSQFLLTTPDGGLPVELDEDQRERAGGFARAEIGFDGLLGNPNGAQWRYSLLASARTTPQASQANLAQYSALLERSATNGQGPYAMVQHQALQRGSTLALRQTQLGLGYDLASGAGCYLRLGLDLQHTSYPTAPLQDGRYIGLLAHTHCPTSDVQVHLRLGEDQPLDATRPGGAQRQASLRISKITPVSGATLALEWEATRQQDQAGYSPLLDNQATRSLWRHAYRTELRWQAGTLKPYLGLEWLDQHSNLSLFELKSRVITLGLRSSW